jgi:anti-anti-sigma regulatory factor
MLIQVDPARHDGVAVLRVTGVLDSATYRELRDAVIKAALDEPRAVLVDVNYLVVPSESAWSVFTSARWHVSTWPDVPILLVCDDQVSRRAIIAIGPSRRRWKLWATGRWMAGGGPAPSSPPGASA